MKFISPLLLFISLAFLLQACSNAPSFDASGSFEAKEVIISSEVSGVIQQFRLSDGIDIKKGDTIGYIDSVQLYLKKKQLLAQMDALLRKKPNISLQLASLMEQVETAEKEKKRLQNLVKAQAATTKQLDDIIAQINLLKSQIEAQKSTLSLSSEGITNDALPLQIQVEQLNDQLKKCVLISPMDGTVLVTYAEEKEMALQGKALYKIANLSQLILRIYISGDQLHQLKLNQEVTVSTDNGNGEFKKTKGTISWISDKAEFTPKTIQTKDERANMVYAVKVKVKNTGDLKLGMYGEVNW